MSKTDSQNPATRLWFVASLTALFMAAALFDLWRLLPPVLHAISFGLFVLILGLCVYRAARELPLPNWAIELLPILKPVGLTLLVIAIPIAGRDAPHRLMTGMLPPDAGVPDRAALDAWVTSPAYTGLPPVTLATASERLDEADVEQFGPSRLTLPEGSMLTVTLEGGWRRPDLVVDGERIAFQSITRNTHRIRARIAAAREIAIYQGTILRRQWKVEMLADAPPVIAFEGEPHSTDDFDLAVRYRLGDDYGVEDVVMQLTRVGLTDATPLEIALVGSGAAGANGASQLIDDLVDLTSHAWAGYTVNARLIARDARGQTARSAASSFVLPDRLFTHPVAQRIKEVRKRLMLSPASRSGPARTLTRIAEQTEAYHEDKLIFLALRSAYYRLKHDKSSRAADEAITILWDTALNLESNYMSAGRAMEREDQATPARG